MAEIGKYNTLKINREVDFGVYLDGEELGEILMPRKYLPENYKIGESVQVFVYTDSEDRLVATTEIAVAQVDECAFLKVVSVTTVGAFLNWGLIKDLLVPYQQQKMKMQENRWYTVFIYLDKMTNRVVASAKIEDFLDNVPPVYAPNQEVELLVYEQTELGYKAVINNLHTGMIYHNEIFKPLRIGEKLPGFIKKVREDEKIDLALQKQGYEHVIDEVSQIVISALNKAGGFLPLTDKTTPEAIYLTLGISKKNFKKSIGNLFKQRIIAIADDGIRLL